MKKATSLSELNKHLQSMMKESLNKEVYEKTVEEQQKSIRLNVLNVYYPKEYVRRSTNRSHGGLIHKGSFMKTLDTKGNSLQLNVANKARFNAEKPSYGGSGSDYLTPLIVKGHFKHPIGYNWFNERLYRLVGYLTQEYAQPRPFVERALKEMQQNKSHVHSMKQGLKRQGLNVK